MNDDSDDFIFPSRELHFIVTRKFEFFWINLYPNDE
jgi:hypothetical protein